MKLIINKYQGNNNQDNSLWYGGKVAEVITDKETYTIEAIGDVRCNLIAKHDMTIDDIDYKKGDVIENVTDKNGIGLFKEKLEKFIKNDDELIQMLIDENPDYELVFGNNNWLELFYESEKESDILDIDSIDGAIKNVLEQINEDLKLEQNNIIYCRSANYSDTATKDQELVCANYINKNNSISKDYDLFVDNGFSGIKSFENPAFSVMINQIKDGKQLYTSDVSRISRNVIDALNICKKIESNNANLLLVNDPNSLDMIKSMNIEDMINNHNSSIENEIEEELEYE